MKKFIITIALVASLVGCGAKKGAENSCAGARSRLADIESAGAHGDPEGYANRVTDAKQAEFEACQIK